MKGAVKLPSAARLKCTRSFQSLGLAPFTPHEKHSSGKRKKEGKFSFALTNRKEKR
jgi:hypothetical protein